MNNFPVKLQYVPLTFINTDNEKIRQIKNTIINKHVLLEKNETKKLANLIINSQYGYTTSAKPEGNYKLLRITDIKNGSVNWDNVPFCECESPEKYLLKPNDILIARTGNNISYLVSDDVPSNAIFASYLIRFTCNEKLNPEYFFTFLNSYAFWSQILAKQQGALLQNVNAKRMGELIIPYCSIEKQKEVLRSNTEIQKDIEKTLNLYKLVTSTSSELINQSSYLTKLRQAILQEAIEGKLTADWRKENPVRMDDPDYDAEALLEKIQIEKEKLIKEGKIKKQKPLAPIKAEEVPFELPEGWVWTRLGEVGFINPRNYIDENLEVSFTPMPLVSAKFGVKPQFEIRKWSQVKNGFTHFAENDVAIAKITPCFENSKAGVFKQLKNRYGAGTTELHVLRPIVVLSDYIYINIKTTAFLDEGAKLMTGAVGQRRVPVDYFSNHFIPLPPIAEQQAIVDRVGKLLSIVDKLEEQVSERKEQSEQLMQAVLREAFEGGK